MTSRELTLQTAVLAISLALAAPALHAQAVPRRLSHWLLEQPTSPNAYPLGLSWRVPEETAAQRILRLELLQSLAEGNREVTANPEAVARLRDWLMTLPVTGRVPVAVPDARWLLANPDRDPILLPGHSIVLPPRPTTVTVVTAEGRLCKVTHQSGHEAKGYVDACSATKDARADWVWIAQPDGRIQRFGIATWNREQQDEPAPGAWLWAPARGSGWTERFSEKLIAFLATQGPAGDERPLPNPPPRGAGEGILTRSAGEGTAAAGFPGSLGTKQHLTVRPERSTRGVEGERPSSAQSVHASTGLSTNGGVHASTGLSTNGGVHASTWLSTNGGVPALPIAEAAPRRSRDLEVSASDWGNVGLLQTPSARMRNVGEFSFNYARIQPFAHGNVFFQPLEWLEAGFRYTAVTNRPYNTAVALGTFQSYKDKSVDVKVRLWPESAYAPQLALGLRDIGGTGLFAGEYLVANKRTGDFDWSLGLGWGYLAGQPRRTTQGTGNFNFSNYFSGPAALFGGVQYHTPWDKVLLKLEYEGNDYQREPQANNQRQDSPWNFGLVYRPWRSVDVTLGVERGNTLMLGFALRTDLDRLTTPKLNDPPRVAVIDTRPQKAPDWAATSREIARQTDWHVRDIRQRDSELRVTIDDAEAVYWRERVDRAAAVLHRDAPQSVDRFVLAYRERGVETAEHVIDRDTWLARQIQPLPPGEQRATVIARPPERAAAENPLYTSPVKPFDGGVRLGFAQTIGGPDAFVLYQIYGEGRAKLRLRDDTWLQGALRLRLADNYDKFTFTAPSNLPRVRTFLREYLTTSEVTMPNLVLAHVGRLTPNQYYSAYGGYLEEMFGGVGGEWLYRPFASRVAFGVDLNEVKQRDFRQDFAFRDYRTTTGHATLYWDTGWNDVLATVSAGRYLAGDYGATLNLSRVFRNGVTIGAFATKTNVSSAEFGEGSFDKGIYLSIPFDAMFSRSSSTIANFVWKPLTRDGGAMLARPVSLYNLTSSRSDRTLQFEPAPLPNEAAIPANRQEAWQPQSAGPEPYTRVTPKPTPAQWQNDTTQEYRLMEALQRQGFRNIRVDYDGSRRLTVTLANDQIRPISRAVGRAARTALHLAPADAREIRIVYSERVAPAVIYDFFDLKRLGAYFNGALKRSELAEYVSIEYLNPAARQKDPLARLDDLDPAADTPLFATLVPETLSAGRVADDFAGAARAAGDVDWFKAGAIGASVVVASSVFDKRAFRFARDHADNRWIRNGVRVGNALPWLGLAASGLIALDGSDPRRSRTGFAAAEAGATALLAATGLKYIVGRARPEAEQGNRSFEHFSSAKRFDAFPSRHTAVAWAVATPFALEYDAPWLYGLAAATNLARIGSRDHWVSDTVAGSLLGYGLGRIFWESSRSRGKYAPRVLLTPDGINLAWETY